MNEPSSPVHPAPRSRWPWWLAGAGLLVLLIAILLPRKDGGSGGTSTQTAAPGQAGPGGGSAYFEGPGFTTRIDPTAKTTATAEEIVAAKLAQYVRLRRDITRAMADKNKVKAPAEVEQLFDALEANDWDKAQTLFRSLTKLRMNEDIDVMSKIWAPIIEAYGVTEQTRAWPAQKLLDYGKAVLGSLGPGMAYVGGTDPGRFIPTLLNETSAGEKHIIVTQNALADGSYLDYVGFLYSDRMTALSSEDSQRAFNEYMIDAQKRLAHDQQFPNEPKQVRPGENIVNDNGRIQISGQVAVMDVNERLLQMLMQKNPDLSFALEESLPLKSTYAEAGLLGPIMELGSSDKPKVITAENATQAVDYWRSLAQQLVADTDAPEGSDPRKAYSKMATAQANLLVDHSFNTQAEQAYRLALQINPANPEAVYGLANLLSRTEREDDARRLVADFKRDHPIPSATP